MSVCDCHPCHRIARQLFGAFDLRLLTYSKTSIDLTTRTTEHTQVHGPTQEANSWVKHGIL